MPSKPKVLSDHRTLSAPTLRGWGAIVAGMLFSAAIAYAAYSASGTLRPFAILFGALFSLVSLAISAYGVRDVIAERVAQNKRGAGSEIWNVDYSWNPDGIAGAVGSQAWKDFVSLSVITLFFMPFHFFFLAPENSMLLAYIIFGFIDFGLAVLWLFIAHEFIRFLRYGNSFLKFDHFPYFLGSELKASLILPKSAQVLRDIKIVLRAVHEKIKFYRRSGQNREEVIVYEVYAQTITLSDVGDAARRQERIPLSFELPDDPDLATALSQQPVQYWEIEASGKATGVDFKTCFLVPVYARGGQKTERRPVGRG